MVLGEKNSTYFPCGSLLRVPACVRVCVCVGVCEYVCACECVCVVCVWMHHLHLGCQLTKTPHFRLAPPHIFTSEGLFPSDRSAPPHPLHHDTHAPSKNALVW